MIPNSSRLLASIWPAKAEPSVSGEYDLSLAVRRIIPMTHVVERKVQNEHMRRA